MKEKKIELTLGEIDVSSTVLNKFMTTQMPIKVSFWVTKSVKSIGEEYKSFIEQRNKLLDRCGEKEDGKLKISEDGTSVKIIPEKLEEFRKELESLLNQKVQVSVFPVPLSLVENLLFTPQEIGMISFLFEVEEEK